MHNWQFVRDGEEDMMVLKIMLLVIAFLDDGGKAFKNFQLLVHSAHGNRGASSVLQQYFAAISLLKQPANIQTRAIKCKQLKSRLCMYVEVHCFSEH